MTKQFYVGDVFTGVKNNGWNTWHEIIGISGNQLTVAQYGKTTVCKTIKMTKSELRYALKKGIASMA